MIMPRRNIRSSRSREDLVRGVPVFLRKGRWRGAVLLAVALGMAAGGPALARPDSRSMSCAAAAALVARRGAVVVDTGANTFDRFVSSLASCDVGEQLKPQWVPTRDNPQCFIGYTCIVPSREGFWGR